MAMEERALYAVEDAAEPPRMQPRGDIERAELAEPFAGWFFDYDSDLTFATLDGLWAADIASVRAALLAMLVGWNFVGKDGEQLSPDAEGMRGVGQALLAATLRAVWDALARPKAERKPSTGGSGATGKPRKASTPTT